MREIQRYRQHAVQVFVGQVSNDSFPRFHIEDIIRTGFTVLQRGMGKELWI